MKVTHIYTGEDNRSHFEDLDIPLERAVYGSESKLIPSSGVIFRENRVGDALDFHTAPRRQFVITIRGVGEIECGDGSRRRFGAGDIMLADDTTGQGHITREIEGPRRAIFIPLPPDLDVSVWRVGKAG
ncbi:MAG TPA: hypothetical protein VLD58_17080 [Gemmatimonadales bacterium]|nr:hypothetical protein [Gemmatimonadales bacterium]